jgi:cyclopropane fatty-acyl-phospholipid synthase-like methyltransferase
LKQEIDFKKDVYEVFLHRNQLFRFSFTLHDLKFYFFTFIKQNFGHSVHADASEVAPVYDRGNDFYAWFLGETMVYTSGMFEDAKESLEVGQKRKLDTVCQYVQMKEGDEHLDIGCGWGTLLIHAAKNYGTKSYGITLAKEQAEFGMARARDQKVSDRVKMDVLDYRLLPKDKKI